MQRKFIGGICIYDLSAIVNAYFLPTCTGAIKKKYSLKLNPISQNYFKNFFFIYKNLFNELLELFFYCRHQILKLEQTATSLHSDAFHKS
jgi:hypothetical protein